MKKTRLRKYARLLARVGLNIHRGQEVFIYAELDQPEFVAMTVHECYLAGAAQVHVEWSHQPLTRDHVRYCKEQVLGTLADWQIAKWEHQAKVLPCKLYLISEDPDGLAGIDQEKYTNAGRAKAKVIKPIRDRMENRYQWCIAAVPGRAWAKKLFPALRASAAVEALWEAILNAARVDEDPESAWKKHNAQLAERCRHLNSLGLTKLIYHAKNGTDLTVGLIPEATFCAGEETTLAGISFNPNIPSEEVFTSPMRGQAEGIVYSSLPLSYDGQLIEDFYFRFEGGRVVDCGAKTNEALLKQMIAMDEGASYLGECALVPASSPIKKTGVLFYNTLFDENAACHLALGRGFTNVLRGYESMSEAQAHAMGINDSVLHEDFMIGTQDLSIVGIDRDGKQIQIFREGEWAF